MAKLTSAIRVSQFYLARRPSTAKLVTVQAGDEIARGVAAESGTVITGTLGRETVQIFSNASRVIEDFANTPDSPEQIRRFILRFGALRLGDIEHLYPNPEDESDFELGDTFRVQCATWRKHQELFGRYWELGSKGGEELAKELSKQIAPRYRSGALVKAQIKWSRLGFQYELQPDDLWRALCLAFIDFSDRMRKCQNPTCETPYFLASRRDQKFCDEKCSRLVANRTWWAKKGSQWRAKKLKERKSK
jgi:hypothetical protein